MKVTALLLQSINGKLAKNNSDKLDWGGSADKKNFAKITKSAGLIIIGRTTFESMGSRPLPGRKTIVLTRNPQRFESYEKKYNSDRLEFSSLSPAKLIQKITQENKFNEIIVAGGSSIYSQFLSRSLIDELIITIAPRIFMSDIDSFDQNSWQKNYLECKLNLINVEKLDQNTIAIKYSVVKNKS